MDNFNEQLNELAKYSYEHSDDIVIINNKIYSLKEINKLSSDDLYKLLLVKPGTKLYKYCPLKNYTKENIINGNVYLNNPLKFDDAFDSLSDVEEDYYIGVRLRFYLQLLKVEYDNKLSNDELEQILFLKMGEIADTVEKFEEYLSKINIDEGSRLGFKVLYMRACLTEFTKKGFIRKRSKHSIKKALLDEYKYYSNSPSRFRISCFTTNPISLKMWSLYANNNKGVCIEYTVPDNPDKHVMSVLYSHIRGDFNTCIAYENLATDEAFMKVLINSVLRKDICWVEQNEYRYVAAKGMYGGDLAKFYPITAIYMGNKISKRNNNYIKDLCKILNIDCYYMQRNLFNFELYPKKITD